jgi:hypothetical protein
VIGKIIQNVKVAYFTGDANGITGCIKRCDAIDAAFALAAILPKRFFADAVRRNNAQASDDDTPHDTLPSLRQRIIRSTADIPLGFRDAVSY